MIPVKTNQSNAVLKPAKGTEASVSPLPVARDPRSVTSTWQLTKDDVALINSNGGLISISIVGQTHPPLFMHVEPDVRKV